MIIFIIVINIMIIKVIVIKVTIIYITITFITITKITIINITSFLRLQPASRQIETGRTLECCPRFEILDRMTARLPCRPCWHSRQAVPE